jgi:flagellar hook-associated protein FlgK
MNIGASALLTQQRAINVAGNNIANVNTPGYSRQTLRLETRTPIASPEGPVGFGVRSAGIERAYDRYLGVQLIGEMSNFGRWEARQGMLERVEVVLDESDGYGLTQALSEFWNAWQNLALNPSGQIEREVTAAAGQSLADTLRRKYTDLEQVQEDIDVAVEGAVEDINRLAAEISELNRKIAQTEVGGIAANDYRDSRDRVLKDLGELIEIHAYEDAQGGIVVSVGSGRALVESGNTYELSTRSVDGHTNILWPDSRSGWADITREISAGRIGGWLQVRDEDLAGYQRARILRGHRRAGLLRERPHHRGREPGRGGLRNGGVRTGGLHQRAGGGRAPDRAYDERRLGHVRRCGQLPDQPLGLRQPGSQGPDPAPGGHADLSRELPRVGLGRIPGRGNGQPREVPGRIRRGGEGHQHGR